MDKLKGFKDLIQDALDKGVTAIEDVHKRTSSEYFNILEYIPLISFPAKGVRCIHDTIVGGVYGAIRLVSKGVAMTADITLEMIERQKKQKIN